MICRCGNNGTPNLFMMTKYKWWMMDAFELGENVKYYNFSSKAIPLFLYFCPLAKFDLFGCY